MKKKTQNQIVLFLFLFGCCNPSFAQSPGNVSGDLTLWLKADAGVTGATPVTAWADQSGNHPDAIQVGTAPDLVNDQVNFNPVLDFDGNNDYLQITGGILGVDIVNDMWVYTVTKADQFSNNRCIIYEKASSGRFAVMPHTGGTTRFYMAGGSYVTPNGANTVDYNIWTHSSSTSTLTPSGTRKSISRDGSYLGAGSTNNTFLTGNNSNFIIGGGWDSGLGTSNNLSDKLAELIVYTGIPTSLEQEKIQSYLAIKYGITKNSADDVSTVGEDEGDYFASDGTTIIWDYSSNLIYHNDIAGIGRDDDTELDQQKSKSQNYQTRVTMDKTAAFGSDKDFIVWGNDATTGTSADVIPGYEVRSNRIWKVAVTGTPGNVSFSVDITGMGFDLIGSVAADFALLIDDNGVFAPDASAHTTGATYTDGVLSFTNVNFSDGDFFAIAGPQTAASPGDVPIDLTLWLKADAGVTGATPVTAWADQSGSAPDAIQVGTAPDLVNDQINFNPVLDFDGNNDYLQITGGILENTETYNDMWVYTVTKADQFSNNRCIIYEKASSGRFAVMPHTGGTTRFYMAGGSYVTPNGANTVDYNIWTHSSSTSTLTPSGTRKSISRDGSYLGVGSTNNTFVTGNNSNFIIGGGWDSGLGTSNNLSDKLAELIVYTGIPTSLDQEKIQSYLAIKYGITKNSADDVSTVGEDEGDYFASDGTTIIWDYSSNLTYHNDVAGIGRDDKTELDQQKSKSQNYQTRVTMDKTAAFGSDKDFIVWGNDATTGTSADVIPGYEVRSNRIWKVAVTGTPGNVSFSADITGMGFDLIGSVAADFALLIDDNGVFVPDASAHTTGATYADGVLSFTNVNFSDGDFFAIAGPQTAASPGDVPIDLTLWLKADAGVTGVTPVTAWADQSGSAPDAIQVGTAPDLVNDQINFNPVLDFDGNNDYLQITGGILENTETYNDMWVYTVTKADQFSNNRCIIYEKASSGRFAVMPHTGGTTRFYMAGGSYVTPNGANTVDYNIWTHSSSTSTLTPSGTRKSISRDGSYLGAGSTNNTFVTGNNSNFIIGGGWDSGLGTSNNLSDKLAELIVYTGIPSPLDQEKIQSYLAIKYGITKNSADDVSTVGEDEGDYFASDGTSIVWDYSSNLTYHNDVAGIGRDDKTELDQQKSKSQNYQTRVTMDKTVAFGSDKDFIVWGNDATTGTSIDVIPGYEVRSNRIWKVAVTGTPGSVSFSVDITGMGFDLIGSVAADFALLIDDNGIFVDASAHTTGATYADGVLSFTNVNFSDGDFFAIAGPQTDVSPGDVPIDLTLWLKADAGVTGTTPVTAWADQSGSVPDAIQVGTAPDLVNDQVNFNPVLDFDGNNDYLQITGGILENTETYNDMWVYTVTKADQFSNNRCIIYEKGSNGRLAVMPHTGGTVRYYIGGGNYLTPNGANLVDYNIWTHSSSTSTLTPSGTRKSISRDGSYLGAGSTNNTFVTGNNSNFIIGGGWDSGLGTSNNLSDKLAELIVYTGIPSPLDQEKIQSYLAVKYSITKNSADDLTTLGEDERDYFASNGTTIVWDYTENTDYNNEIIGLGRDDKTALMQKQSIGSDDSLIVFVGDLAPDNLSNIGSISNDISYLMIGNDRGLQQSTEAANLEKPDVIYHRLEREWKVTNTKFTDTYSIEIEWDSTGGFDIDDIRLLVDIDGDFTDATVYSAADGLTFSNGSIIVSGINTTHIPANSTRYITLGSIDLKTPLPIELVAFNAALTKNETVKLNWQTASEINNDYFSTERSKNGIDWEWLQNIPGAGNSSSVINYSTYDEKPYMNISYYRLKQTDFDGQYAYSDIKSVNIEPNQSFSVNIYPNPSDGQIVVVSDSSEELIDLKIYNVLGQEVTGITSQSENAKSEITIDLTQLSAGTYYLITNTNVSKFYKQ